MEIAKSAASIYEIKAFHDLSDASKSLLARGLRYVQCGKGAPILAKGQRISGAYVVISGQLRVFTLSPDGNEATLYVINPHETCVLALNCIFNDLLYPAWVEAGSATRVAVISGTVFRAAHCDIERETYSHCGGRQHEEADGLAKLPTFLLGYD